MKRHGLLQDKWRTQSNRAAIIIACRKRPELCDAAFTSVPLFSMSNATHAQIIKELGPPAKPVVATNAYG